MDYGKNLQRSMNKYNMVYSKYQLYIKRFVKSSITNAHPYKISKQDLIAIQKQAVAKAPRKKLDKKVAQKGEVVTVGQIRAKIQKLDNEEVMKVQIALDCAITAKNCKVQTVINANKKLCKDMFKEVKGILIAHKKV